MKKSMCITYVVENGLYVNMTNRCSNSCDFCIRNNGDGAYGSDSLWLSREPTVEETVASILSHDLTAFAELVFCGYGEPTYRLDDIRAVALEIKAKYPKMQIRVNTNGHSDLIFGRNTAPDYKGAFDVVSISLNTPSPEKYAKICHPIFGDDAHSALIDFARRVKDFVPCVVFSVVRQTLTESELDECRKIADTAGVKLKIRDYIAPED